MTLESGSYLELTPGIGCRLLDERGEFIQEVQPEGKIPVLATGRNEVKFTCEEPEGYNARAEVDVTSSFQGVERSSK